MLPELTNKPSKTAVPLTLDEYVLQVYLEEFAEQISLKRTADVVVPRKQLTALSRASRS